MTCGVEVSFGFILYVFIILRSLNISQVLPFYAPVRCFYLKQHVKNRPNKKTRINLLVYTCKYFTHLCSCGDRVRAHNRVHRRSRSCPGCWHSVVHKTPYRAASIRQSLEGDRYVKELMAVTHWTINIPFKYATSPLKKLAENPALFTEPSDTNFIHSWLELLLMSSGFS